MRRRRLDPIPTIALAAAGLPLGLGVAHGFYLDDLSWLEAAARAGRSLPAILSPWRTGEFRPLAQLLFSAQWIGFGFSPAPYNLVSLGLHAVAVVLVARLGRACGLSGRAAWLAAALFGGGLGHYNKTAAWACAQGSALSTALVLAAALPFFRRVEAPIGRWGLLGSMSALAAALLAHELAAAVLLGLAVVVWWRRHPRRRAVAAAVAVVLGAYAIGSLDLHREHRVASQFDPAGLERVLTYPAAFVLPAQAPAAVARVLGVSASARWFHGVERLLPSLVGLVVLIAVRRAARSLSPSARDAAVIGLFPLALSIALPRPAGWVEARHLYPVAAFVAPAVLEAMVAASRALAMRPDGLRAFAFRFGVALWLAGVVAGSAYMQRHAWEIAREPATEARLARIRADAGR